VPDLLQIFGALAVAAVTAAGVRLVCSQPWRIHCGVRAAIGDVLGIAAGIAVACVLLGRIPHWPPREDQDRLLLVLFPMLVVVELIAAGTQSRPRPAWLLRGVIAAAAAPILLYNSIYLSDAAGPGTRAWSIVQSGLILIGLAAALVIVWGLLGLHLSRTRSRSVPLSIAMACAAAAITVMLSGYASGGQIGLGIAAALIGVLTASLAPNSASNLTSSLSLGVVGLFAVIVIGRFFGELTLANAACVMFAPLACWIPELPFFRKIGVGTRACLSVLLVMTPLLAAVVNAQHRFAVDSNRSSSESNEPSADDYREYLNR
jgi:hypothetical protein